MTFEELLPEQQERFAVCQTIGELLDFVDETGLDLYDEQLEAAVDGDFSGMYWAEQFSRDVLGVDYDIS